MKELSQKAKRNVILICIGVLFVVLILLCIMLIADAKYEAIYVSSCDCSDRPRYIEKDMPWRSKASSYQDESAKKELSIEFNGKSYIGNYKYSRMNLPDMYVEHTYLCEKEDENIRFSVDSDTGNVTRIYIPYKKDKIIEDEDICKEVIDAFVSKYINVSDYEVYSSGGEGDKAYSHVYYRNVDGYKTSERLEISVDADGRIYKFEAHSVGEFDNIKKVECNVEKAKKAIADKLDKIYEDDDDNWTDFEVTGVSLVKLNHRKYGFWCETRVYESDDYHLFTFLVK